MSFVVLFYQTHYHQKTTLSALYRLDFENAPLINYSPRLLVLRNIPFRVGVYVI